MAVAFYLRRPRREARPPSTMGFDEEIADHIPSLIRDFITLCHHKIPYR